MTKTTEQWEALLDGITPGRWDRGANPREIYAVDDADRATFVGSTYTHNAHSGADAEIFASAPAAVAEVIRLRKAIAELAAEERATAEDEFYPVLLRVLCRTYADELTRILEGDRP